MFKELPNKKYKIIYADPPWEYKEGLWERPMSKAKSHYSLMPIQDICSLPIKNLADENAHLYLWIPSQQLGNGYAKLVCEAWGFRIMNIITWVKPQISLGYYFRNNTEHLIFGVKGKFRTLDRKQGTNFIFNRGKHSEKPKEVRDLIIKWSGNVPRIELFARQKVEGWDAWGDEI
jgi:N6-adenosine-specific RNA methylase IME4